MHQYDASAGAMASYTPLQRIDEPCGAPEDSKARSLMVAFPFVPGDHRRSSGILHVSTRASSPMSPLFRISLKELLGLMLFVGIMISSMRYGTVLASTAISLALLITMSLAIVAFVAVNEPRAFAVGFLVPVATYAAAILVVGKTEYGRGTPLLATTKLLESTYPFVAQQSWVDALTGQVISNIDPEVISTERGIPLAKHKGTFVHRIPTPSRSIFLGIGHVLTAMILGYIGGKFGVTVHRWQRTNRFTDEPCDEPESSS